MNSEVIQRWAIDDRGCLGCLYDICRDCVLGRVNVRSNDIQSENKYSFKCEITKPTDSKKRINLLEMLNIEKDLQLSLLLNLSSKTNTISSIMNYTGPVNNKTRFLIFQCLNDEECLINTNRFKLSPLETTATHLIIGIIWGFYAIVVLELPEKEEADSMLKKMCATSVFNDYDNDLAEHITIVKIFSNVYDLTTLTDLSTVWKRIDQMKNSIISYPMRYILQPLSNLLMDTRDQTVAAFMHPSGPFTSILLMQVLNLIQSRENIELLLDNYRIINKFYYEYQLWLDLKRKYSNEMERISKHVIASRSDQCGLIELKSSLDDIDRKTLQQNLVQFEKNLKNPREFNSIIRELSPPIVEETTILLLGETGVGKSTFINALVNYLTYESLAIAESNEPIALIPISFMLTVGEQFEEHTITLDSTFRSDDENFNIFGQSVTQHCRSYILQLKNNRQRKLRLIDTPGFGDTRGLAQDERNMQHIHEYINSLPYINAICYLFKSNSACVHPFFRSSITQLLDQLGQQASKNIVFCFTNTRGTFFTPGDTASSLKTILSPTIQLQKENTFCFDSESFRYLAAIHQHVPIDSVDKRQYKLSWTMSVKESNRLLNYICDTLSVYRTENERQSIKNIQFEILHLVRPICEGIRNILRNIILKMSINSKHFIELHPKSVFRLATRCQSCHSMPIQCGPFFILPDIGHEIQDRCLTCSCDVDQHSPIEYMLEYRYVDSHSDTEELSSMIEPLFVASIQFAYFLIETTHCTRNDPFHENLNRLINEEMSIVEKVQPSEANFQLRDQLKNILNEYENTLRDMKQQDSFDSIHQHIQTVSNHPMIREQIAVIKESQARLMHIFEYES